jgi:glutamine synthetase
MAKDSAVEKALKMIKDKDVKFVDLRFTDPRGKMQHLTMDISQMVHPSLAGRLSMNPT